MNYKSETPRTTLRYEADKYAQGAFSAYKNMRDLAIELERELAAMTKPSDVLADLVKQFIYILDITEESDEEDCFTQPTSQVAEQVISRKLGSLSKH